MKDKKYYGHDYYDSMNKLVNKVWLIVSLLIVSALITFAIYFFNNSLNKKMNIGFNETNVKIDSVDSKQSEILSNLNSINEKLDLNDEMITNRILDLNLNVNKINRSVTKIGNNIDSIVVYIKK